MKKTLTILSLCIALGAAATTSQRVMQMKMKDGTVRHYLLESFDEVGILAEYHEYVDLGLPSGNLWATCNIGAQQEQEYGDYYQYGTDVLTDSYATSKYQWYNLHRGRAMFDNITDWKYNAMPEFDTANMLWEDTWHVPTRADWQELIDKCSWQWTSVEGINGSRITGPNGNSIFLPAAGYYNGNSNLDQATSNCNYRTQEFKIHFNSRNGWRGFYDQSYDYFGMPIRPVLSPAPFLYPIKPQVVSPDKRTNTVNLTAMGLSYFTASSDIAGVVVTQDGNQITTTFTNDPADEDRVATITVTATDLKGRESTLTYTVTQARRSPYLFVDLGLPSGTQWATADLGSDTPEGRGVELAFGELFPKTNYASDQQLWYYNISAADALYAQIFDENYNLMPDYDAAHAWLGSGYNVPTRTQWEELRDNCFWKRSTLNGKNGFQVTARNGNSIFIPAWGYMRGTGITMNNSHPHYWTSSRDIGYMSYYLMTSMDANSDINVTRLNEPYLGMHIRPVTSMRPSISAVSEQFVIDPEYVNEIEVTGNNLDRISAVSSNSEIATVAVSGMTVTTTFHDGITEAYVDITLTGYSDFDETTEQTYRVSRMTDGYKAIDLGLPSGRKWANRNVEAQTPADAGIYVSYGMLCPASNFTNAITDFGNMQTTGMQYLGAVDADYHLTHEYDLASQKIGEEWRTPTKEELQELQDNCEWNIVNAGNSQACFKVTGPNGNYILLPMAGFRDGSALNAFGQKEQIWSSTTTPNSNRATYSNHHYYKEFMIETSNGSSRHYGFPVRGVYDPKPAIKPVRTQRIPNGQSTNTVTISARNTASLSATSSNSSVSVTYSGMNVTATFPTAGSEEVSADITVTATSPTGSTSSMTYTVKQLPQQEYEYVDLGLPSGIVWATFNVGTDNPLEEGTYFSWGETEPNTNYSNTTTSWVGCTADQLRKQGIINNAHRLTADFDAATIWWGAPWRMASDTEYQELIDNCTWRPVVINETNYLRVTGRNGNSIMIPTSGYWRGTSKTESGQWGHHWTSNYQRYFRSKTNYIECLNLSELNLGMHVRPVRDDVPSIVAIPDVVLNGDEYTAHIPLTTHNVDYVTVTSESAHLNATYDGNSGIDLHLTVATGNGQRIKVIVQGSKAGKPYAETSFYVTRYSGNSADYIDLGLPSGTLWADRNLNAATADDPGDYIGYGDIVARPDGSLSMPWNGYSTRALRAYGIVDQNFDLTPANDPATQRINANWHTPRRSQVEELMNKCEWHIIKVGNRNCWRITGPNGKFIIVPIAGYKNSSNRLSDDNVQCDIHTSTSKDLSNNTYYSVWKAKDFRIDSLERVFGLNLRPVYNTAPRFNYVRPQHVTADNRTSTVTISGINISSISATSSDPTVATVTVNGMHVITNFNGFSTEDRTVNVTVTGRSAWGTTNSLSYTVEQLAAFNQDYVDLGLPSGLLWSTFNVGTTSITDYGYSFGWGEIEHLHNEGNNYDAGHNSFNGRQTSELSARGIVDYSRIDDVATLVEQYDVAAQWWHEGWRMPTHAEVQELIDNCTFTRIAINGIYGHKITNKTGDGSAWIFIPDAGYYRGTRLYDRGGNSHLWTSSAGRTTDAYYFRVANGGTTLGCSGERNLGMAIRPVREAAIEGMPTITPLPDICVENSNQAIIIVNGSNIGIVKAIVDHPERATVSVNGQQVTINFIAEKSTRVNVTVAVTSPAGKSIFRNFNVRYLNSDGVEYVDLGLPSGLLWATCNIGADSPEDNGDFFQWGDVEVKTWFDTSNVLNGNKSIAQLKSEGIIDESTNCLTAPYDPATYYLGDEWHSPKAADYTELRNNCYFTLVTMPSGVRATRIQSRINGNFIYLPLCGRRSGTNHEYFNSYGEHWCSDVNADQRPCWVSIAGNTYTLYTNQANEFYRGRPIRAVRESAVN